MALNDESKSFYKSLVTIVIPIVIQNFITAAVGSTDVIMLSFVSQTALAAVSLANQIQFLLTMIFTGLSSGLVMLSSQYWGKRDTYSLKALLGIALRSSLSCGILAGVITTLFPSLIMRIFTFDEALIENGAIYLRVVGISYVFLSVSSVFHAMMRSIERVKTTATITLISLSLNVFLNACFIFGLFSFPKCGVLGVGIATSISRLVETILCIIIAKRIRVADLSLNAFFIKNRVLFKDFIHYSLPALANELIWGAALVAYSAILGHTGEDIVAAKSVISAIRNLTAVVYLGMAYGGAIILGGQIGSGALDLAERNSSRLVKSTIAVGFLSAILLYSLKPLLPYVATLSPGAADYRDKLLLINCFSSLGSSINAVLICGVFRAGGDSKYGFKIDTIIMWFVSVPLGLIASYLLKLSPVWIYFILYLDEYEKMPFVIKHYFKRGWLKNITRDKTELNE